MQAFEDLKQQALKITEALYRVTEIFYDGEPLKWTLRKSALDILDAVTNKEVSKIEGLVKGLLLKLELASGGAFISKMNFGVLDREYLSLMDKVLSQRDEYQNLLDNILSDKVLATNKPVMIEAKNSAESSINVGRKDKILAVLKEKGSSSVGELAGAFDGAISEKTVQRELGSLVISGAVKQTGDKRWRRYFIE